MKKIWISLLLLGIAISGYCAWDSSTDMQALTVSAAFEQVQNALQAIDGSEATGPSKVIATSSMGIGITNPTVTLDIRNSSTAPFTDTLYIRTAGTTSNFALRIADSIPTDRLVIQDNGNIGIGTTAPVGIFQIGTSPSPPLFVSSLSGNVGIGTTSPQQKLDIVGNLVFEGSTVDGNETLFSITDPTADRTITIPNKDVTLDNLSNVIFSFSLGGGSASANAYGMILNDSILAANTEIMAGYWGVNGATYQTLLTSKFVKLNGISTVTVWASIWQGGGGGGNANCKVIIGSVNGEKTAAWSGLATPGWDSFTIDVSGLTNGSTYDVSIQISAGGAYMSYMDSIIGIGS